MIVLEIIERQNNEWSYRFKSKNGNILVWSETYSKKGNAKKAASNFLDSMQDFLLKQTMYIEIDKNNNETKINEVL